MFFGVDIGGQSVKIGAFEHDVLIEKWSIVLNVKTKEDLVDTIYDSIKSKYDNVEGIGIGCPGFIANNRISHSANIHFLNNSDLVQLFKERKGVTVKLINDANAAALGEARHLGYSDLLFVTLGTGVGGGLVTSGKVLEGIHGAGMEIGHVYIASDEYNFPCGCGSRNCLETFSSTKGVNNLVKFYRDQYNTKLGNEFTVKDVFDLAKCGDELALKVVDVFTDTLGIALANVAIVVDPGVIMLGGGISNAGEYLRDLVEKAFRRYAIGVVKDTKIILAGLGSDAGIYGGYYLVKE